MSALLRSSARVRSVPRLSAVRSISSSPRLQVAEGFYFPNEPSIPKVSTAIPGPKNQQAASELNEVFDIRSLNMLTDFNKSIGN